MTERGAKGLGCSRGVGMTGRRSDQDAEGGGWGRQKTWKDTSTSGPDTGGRTREVRWETGRGRRMVASENKVALGIRFLIRQALSYAPWCDPEVGPAQQ